MKGIIYVKTWVTYTLISLLGGFIVGAVQGFILGLILSLCKVSFEVISKTTAVTGFIAGLVISFFVFKWSIEKFILPQTTGKQEANQA